MAQNAQNATITKVSRSLARRLGTRQFVTVKYPQALRYDVQEYPKISQPEPGRGRVNATERSSKRDQRSTKTKRQQRMNTQGFLSIFKDTKDLLRPLNG